MLDELRLHVSFLVTDSDGFSMNDTANQSPGGHPNCVLYGLKDSVCVEYL